MLDTESRDGFSCTEGHADMDILTFVGDYIFIYTLSDPVGGKGGCFQGLAEQEEDLLTAPSADEIVGTYISAYDITYRHQHHIAGFVTVGVIDAFEIIYVAEDDSEASTCLLKVVHMIPDKLVHAASVQEMSEGVFVSQFIKLVILLLENALFAHKFPHKKERERYHKSHAKERIEYKEESGPQFTQRSDGNQKTGKQVTNEITQKYQYTESKGKDIAFLCFNNQGKVKGCRDAGKQQIGEACIPSDKDGGEHCHDRYFQEDHHDNA